MRPIVRAAQVVVAVVVALALAAATGALVPGPVTARPGGAPVTIGLAQGPIHTDLILPVTPQLRAALPFLDVPQGAVWLSVGWGARGVYTTLGDWGDVRAGSILRAVTGDEAVIRFQPVWDWTPPATATLSGAGYAALLAAIAAETRADAPAGRDLFAPGDRYYAAAGRFTAISTCNQWAARRLREAGLPFGAWTPTTWAFRLSHWRFAPADEHLRAAPLDSTPPARHEGR